MPTTLQHRRYSTSALSSITGANGEIIIDSDKDVVTVHDGSTAGGFALAPAAAYDQANNARNQANTARDQANNAYGEANLKLNLAGGTISGDLVVSGNLEVLGNTTTLNVETLSVEDNEIILNSNVTGAPSLNAFVTINRGTSNDVSIKWDESTGQWKWGDDDQIYYAFDSALDGYAQANSARDQANTARNTANDAYGQANTARDTANASYGQANTARDTANASYGQANAAYNAANNAQVTVYANNASGKTTQFINFANTATIQVAVSADGSNANVEFVTIGDSSAATVQGAYGQANSARDQANTARNTANDSYGQANTARDTANDAYGQANTANTNAVNAYGAANTANTNALNAYGQANSAYNAANNAQVTVYQNSASAVTTQKINFVNTATITVSVTNESGNANIEFTAVGGAAYDQANAAYNQANSARDQANTARNTANDAYGGANTANTNAINAYAQANTARDTANDAYGQANTARDQANTARDTANSAYGEANLKLNLTGGSLSGSLNIVGDLSVTNGNIYLTGNTTFINVATFVVDDALIYLGANNTISDTIDLGFVAAKNSGPLTTHTGLARDASDGTWYLFDNLSDAGHQANVIDFANTNLATLRANINANSILWTGNAVATQANLTLAHDQANTARNTANDAYGQANTARDQANTARNTANDAYAGANTANTNALNAYTQANTARDQANTARDTANDAYGQANTARDTANNAYNTANNAVVASGGTATTLTLKAYREGINTRTITGSTVTADLSGNNIFDFTLQAATVTITFTNAAASGNSHPVTVLLRQPGTAGNTVAYANTVNWSNAEEPTLASGIASRLDIISLVTVDGGTTFFAAHSMANVAY